MKKMTLVKYGSIEAEFDNTDETRPSDLIGLSKEYVLHVQKLMEYIKKIHVKIVFFRIEEEGKPCKKELEGKVSNINFGQNSFDFCPKENEESGIVMHVRTDNVLGLIPMIPGCDINPYQNSHTKTGMTYLHQLNKLRELTKFCVGLKHSAVLFYKNKNNQTEEVFAEILKVNKSNIEILQHKTSRMFEGGKSITTGKQYRTELNLSTERYLYKVSVIFGLEHNISPFDDGETC